MQHHIFLSKLIIYLPIPILDPRSSLLTIGRVPMMNALQNYSRHFACQQPPIVHAQRDYQLACKNTCAFPVCVGVEERYISDCTLYKVIEL